MKICCYTILMLEINRHRYYILKEAAEMLKIAPRTLRNWIKDKKIAAKRHSRYVLIAETEIDRYLAELPDAKK